jgi:hypothetical protein
MDAPHPPRLGARGLREDVKPLLKFSILADHEDRHAPVRVDVCLFRENAALVWRLHGPLVDECETLPRPLSVEQAKDDARLVYKVGSVWSPQSTWHPA